MFCRKCGTEINDSAIYCPNCGTEVHGDGNASFNANANANSNFNANASQSDNFGVSEVRQRFIDMFKDPLFLVSTILFTVSIFFSFNILTVIGVIFFWIIYAGATNKELKIGQIKNVKTLLAVQYAFQIVATVLVGLGLAMLIIFRPLFDSDTMKEAMRNLLDEDIYSLDAIRVTLTNLTISLFVSLAVAILGIVAFNCFKKCADDLYTSAVSERLYLPNLKTARTWCIIYGVVLAGSNFVLGNNISPRQFITAGTIGGAYILMSVLLDKYFGKETDSFAY